MYLSNATVHIFALKNYTCFLNQPIPDSYISPLHRLEAIYCLASNIVFQKDFSKLLNKKSRKQIMLSKGR